MHKNDTMVARHLKSCPSDNPLFDRIGIIVMSFIPGLGDAKLHCDREEKRWMQHCSSNINGKLRYGI